MAAPLPDTNAWAVRSARATLTLAAWTAAWVATLALAAFGPGALWNDEPAPTIAATVVNVLVGIGMLLANKRNLQAMDELQRAIQLQAMAWSLGTGLVGVPAWTLLARHGVIGVDVEVAHLIGFMAVVYVVGCFIGVLRYR